MAAWCRKCIYLKPKLEKLAAEYEDKWEPNLKPIIRFFFFLVILLSLNGVIWSLNCRFWPLIFDDWWIFSPWKLISLLLSFSFNRIKFYSVDVNNVPQALVKRGNISVSFELLSQTAFFYYIYDLRISIFLWLGMLLSSIYPYVLLLRGYYQNTNLHTHILRSPTGNSKKKKKNLKGNSKGHLCPLYLSN